MLLLDMHYKPKSPTVPHINLLPKDPFFDTIVGKTMVWAISVGRYIIVFTEVIVIMSFASRFKLDRDLTDLTSKVIQKQAVIQSYGDTELRIRALQEKIGIIDNLLSQAENIKVIDRLAVIVPVDVQLTQLSIRPDEIHLSGNSRSSTGIAMLLTAIQKDPSFSSVTVDRIASGESRDPVISFSIRAGLVQPEGKKAPTAPVTAPIQPIPDEELGI